MINQYAWIYTEKYNTDEMPASKNVKVLMYAHTASENV